MAGARDKKPVKVAPLPEGAGQRSGRQGLKPNAGAEGAGLDLGERFWAFWPPRAGSVRPAASQPQSLRRGSLLARPALSIPPRSRARFSALALPGAGNSEACP